ncbi:hypothetical protein [Streptomyces sp. NPDC006971]|uniref:hypothetical protein n=1 Tax=Streptomyces sp. NPDC006971 TaxID=3154784 RepID=UPI0033E056C5
MADQTGPDLVKFTPPMSELRLTGHDRSGRRMTVRRRATGKAHTGTSGLRPAGSW